MPRVTNSRFPRDLMLLPAKIDPACKNSERKLGVWEICVRRKRTFQSVKTRQGIQTFRNHSQQLLVCEKSIQFCSWKHTVARGCHEIRAHWLSQNSFFRKFAWWKAFVNHSRVSQINSSAAEKQILIDEGTLSAWNIHVLCWISNFGLIYWGKEL